MKRLDVAETFPALVAVNHKRSYFRNFRSGFDQQGIDEFLSDLVKGKGRNFKLEEGALNFEDAGAGGEKKKMVEGEEKDEL